MSKSSLAIVLVFALVAAAVFYHTMTNVHDGDVAALNNVPQQMRGLFVKAGDIVAVTRDGRNPERICNADSEFEEQLTNAVYVNELARNLPTLTALIAFANGVFGSDTGKSQPDSVRFAGKIMMMKQPNGEQISDACSCEIARRLAENELVCTTHTAMIAIGTNYAEAVRFKRHSIVVQPSRFAECGIAPVDLGELPPCDQFGRVSWDVSLRQFFNLVERREVQEAPVSEISRRAVGLL
jgi:hypothetical protein